MIDAERTGFARANLVSTHLDLQPAVAASRARTAASSLTLLFHWLVHVGSGFADFSSVGLGPKSCMQDTTGFESRAGSTQDLPGLSKMSALLPLCTPEILYRLN
jgi:hypothetical protein